MNFACNVLAVCLGLLPHGACVQGVLPPPPPFAPRTTVALEALPICPDLPAPPIGLVWDNRYESPPAEICTLSSRALIRVDLNFRPPDGVYLALFVDDVPFHFSCYQVQCFPSAARVVFLQPLPPGRHNLKMWYVREICRSLVSSRDIVVEAPDPVKIEAVYDQGDKSPSTAALPPNQLAEIRKSPFIAAVSGIQPRELYFAYLNGERVAASCCQVDPQTTPSLADVETLFKEAFAALGKAQNDVDSANQGLEKARANQATATSGNTDAVQKNQQAQAALNTATNAANALTTDLANANAAFAKSGDWQKALQPLKQDDTPGNVAMPIKAAKDAITDALAGAKQAATSLTQAATDVKALSDPLLTLAAKEDQATWTAWKATLDTASMMLDTTNTNTGLPALLTKAQAALAKVDPKTAQTITDANKALDPALQALVKATAALLSVQAKAPGAAQPLLVIVQNTASTKQAAADKAKEDLCTADVNVANAQTKLARLQLPLAAARAKLDAAQRALHEAIRKANAAPENKKKQASSRKEVEAGAQAVKAEGRKNLKGSPLQGVLLDGCTLAPNKRYRLDIYVLRLDGTFEHPDPVYVNYKKCCADFECFRARIVNYGKTDCKCKDGAFVHLPCISWTPSCEAYTPPPQQDTTKDGTDKASPDKSQSPPATPQAPSSNGGNGNPESPTQPASPNTPSAPEMAKLADAQTGAVPPPPTDKQPAAPQVKPQAKPADVAQPKAPANQAAPPTTQAADDQGMAAIPAPPANPGVPCTGTAATKAAPCNVDKGICIDFPQAARFAIPTFAPSGNLIEQNGLVIYEGMRLIVAKNGKYEVFFTASMPNMPVTIRLQLVVMRDNHCCTVVTLPPIVIDPNQATDRDSGMPGVTRGSATNRGPQGNYLGATLQVRHCGCSVNLAEVVYEYDPDSLTVIRQGTARFGSYPPSGSMYGSGSQ